MKWIVRAYGGNILQETVDTIPKLRWYLFSKFPIDISKFPPTIVAVKFKMIQSFYRIGTP